MAKKPVTKKPVTKKPATKKPVKEDKSIDIKKSDIVAAISEIKLLKVPRRKTYKTLGLLESMLKTLK